MGKNPEIARCCATIGEKEAKPLDWEVLAEVVNERNPDKAPISAMECQEIISHNMHNYGYPNYDSGRDLYPSLINPWVSDDQNGPDDQKDPFVGTTNIQERVHQDMYKHQRGSSWDEEAPDIEKPRPAHLSLRKPSKPSTDIVCEQEAGEKIVSARISSPQKS